MQDEEKSPLDQQQQPPVRVQEIRRQWAVHEDGALAYRLQNEEITQHYSGNRTRNAIVREDTPKAREEQRKEEKEALEHRFQHLHLLQQQAEEDAQLAKELANRFEMGMEGGSLLQAGSLVGAAANSSSLAIKPDEEFDFHSTSIEKRQASECAFPSTGALSHSPVETFNHLDNQYSGASGPVVKRPQKISGNSTSPPLNNGSNNAEKKVVKSIMKPSNRKEMFTPLFKSQPSSEGAACSSSSTASSSCLSSAHQGMITLDPELANLEMELPPLEEVQKAEQKILQEKLDEEMALKLQKEFEQMEIDKRVAVEAQDRELAKMIHQKEKERLRRAKERAKLKAAAAALESNQSNANPTEGIEISPGPSYSPLSERSSSVEIGPNPPRIPEKSHSRLDRDDPIRFRAESKPLPPLHCPVESQSPSRRISSSSRSNSSTHSITLQDNFAPPYMPQSGVATGVQNVQKKKK